MMEHIDDELVQAILEDNKLGIWTIKYDSRHQKNMMVLDEGMQEMLAVKNANNYIRIYDYWFRRIFADDTYAVLEFMIDMIAKEKFCHIEYLWNHPELGVQKYHMSGKLDGIDDEGYIILKGHCQNITEDSKDNQSAELAQQLAGEKRRLWNVMKTTYIAEAKINIETETIKQTLFADDGTVKCLREQDYHTYITNRILDTVEESYQKEVQEFLDFYRIKKMAENPMGAIEEAVRYFAKGDKAEESQIYEESIVYSRDNNKLTVSLLLKDITKEMRHEMGLTERKKKLEQAVDDMIDNGLEKERIILNHVRELQKYVAEVIDASVTLTASELSPEVHSRVQHILKNGIAAKEKLEAIANLPKKI